MVLSPSEKCPTVLLRWSPKAQKHPELIQSICSEFKKHRLVMVPTPASRDICLLTAAQESLEWQAERDLVVKKRRINGPSSVETIMDYFKVQDRNDFRALSSPPSTSSAGLGADGLFSVHERCHLVLGLIELISVSDAALLRILVSEEDPQKLDAYSSNLRYLLQSNGWIDLLTPIHVDQEKVKIQFNTWYPLSNMMPPVEEIEAYYGSQIAYYFAFMGFLGQWLGRLGIVGLSVFLFRMYRQDTIDEDEVCIVLYD
jgi:hypothetical protein